MLSLAAIASSVYGQTRVTPALSVSERYDTNVFFFNSGEHLEDFVTSVAPQLNVGHNGRLIDGSAQVTVIGEAYVRNPGLNYIAVNASFNASLDRLTGLIDKRWKLSVTEYVTYTPQPPAFFSPQGAGGTNVDPAAPANFIRGVQAVRANSLINVASVSSSYQISPVTSLAGAFTNQYMRFGTSFAPTPGQGFFTTNYSSLSLGPRFTVSARDTITANYQYSHMSFSQGSQFSSGFDLQGGTAGWDRAWSPKLTTNVTAGATVFSSSSSLQYLASASVTWHERNTDFIFSYSRSIFPSFFIAAVPLLSQVISASVLHRFTERLSGTVAVNYGRNEAVGDTPLQFDSYGGSATMNYAISKTWSLAASYGHTIVKNSFGGNNFDFDRDVISVTLRKEWPDFFQPK